MQYLFGRRGLGIVNPVEIADKEYHISIRITEELVGLIYRHETTLKKLDGIKIKCTVDSLELAKELWLKKELAEVTSAVDVTTRESGERARWMVCCTSDAYS